MEGANYGTGFKFCLAEDDQKGYCCLDGLVGETTAECSSTERCSAVIPSSSPLTQWQHKYYAFWPTVQTDHTNKCGGSQTYEATRDKKTVKFEIPANGGYTCEFGFYTPDLTYRTSSLLTLYIEEIGGTSAYLYRGHDRSNLTTLVQQNQVVPVGAPVSTPVDDGIILLVHTGGASASI